jgi:hypothetical protein
LNINPSDPDASGRRWLGRTDVIPPASDLRTALVDRGLVLRGYLTEEEIKEIHRVGDLWLERHEFRNSAIAAGGEAAVANLKAERAARKTAMREYAAYKKQKRATEIAQRKKEDIIFAGRGVSYRLSQRESDIAALQKAGLPLLSTPLSWQIF